MRAVLDSTPKERAAAAEMLRSVARWRDRGHYGPAVAPAATQTYVHLLALAEWDGMQSRLVPLSVALNELRTLAVITLAG